MNISETLTEQQRHLLDLKMYFKTEMNRVGGLKLL